MAITSEKPGVITNKGDIQTMAVYTAQGKTMHKRNHYNPTHTTPDGLTQ
jgi:hypothetical protein